jgi:hypothetical protein
MHRFARIFSLCFGLCFGLMASAAFAAAETDAVTVDHETEGVIHGALAWLAKNQALNGSWAQSKGLDGEAVAMTGYTLMAFMSTGNLPDEGEYGHNVTLGMQYLLGEIQPDGTFRDAKRGAYMYNHGIATVALSEMYGQTQSPALRKRLEQIVGVIVSAQNPLGGWRYTPTSRDADISVTVLQLAALRSAKNVGIAVPQETIDRAVAYVGSCFNERDGGYGYQPGKEAGFSRTAAAIYSLQVCGLYTNPQVAKGSDYLFAHGDEHQGYWAYGCYYAAPAEYMIGGDSWKHWYEQMKSILLTKVNRQGDLCSWRSVGGGGMSELYETAVFTTVLAMPYHYIPLYQR